MEFFDTQLRARLEQIQRQAEEVQGWLNPWAGAMLYVLARYFAPADLAVVELGAWKGRSALWLASALDDRGAGLLHSVDTWEGTANEAVHHQLLRDYDKDGLYREFLGNLRGAHLDSRVRPWRMDTQAAARAWAERAEPIGLLFIDADHDYEAVKADFEAWSPFVAKGGFVVFDDVPNWPGPTRLVSRLPADFDWVVAPPGHWTVVRGDGTPCRERLQSCLETVRALLPKKTQGARWRARSRKLLRGLSPVAR